MYRVDGTEKCFIQWKEKCAVYYRWTNASSSISGKPMARIYHSNMLVYAQSLPVGHKRGIDIQVVSIEPGKGPTTGRDRYLSKSGPLAVPQIVQESTCLHHKDLTNW